MGTETEDSAEMAGGGLEGGMGDEMELEGMAFGSVAETDDELSEVELEDGIGGGGQDAGDGETEMEDETVVGETTFGTELRKITPPPSFPPISAAKPAVPFGFGMLSSSFGVLGGRIGLLLSTVIVFFNFRGLKF